MILVCARRLPRGVPLYPMLGFLGACAAQALAFSSVCTSAIYCQGGLLNRVQLSRIFQDSKTFVDLHLVYSENDTLADFSKLLNKTNGNPSREMLKEFVSKYFMDGDELEHWMPSDFNPDPPLLNRIRDPNLRKFAKDVVSIWTRLGRRVISNVIVHPESYSFLPVPNGFIVPGGRFKELYYWDSFWTVRGLLVSNMHQTARGMIENLLHLVDVLGYVPNGSRRYYLGRSQPPLLAAMVASYFSETGDLSWLEKYTPTVERELRFWLDHKKVSVNVKNSEYVLLRYLADEHSFGPRPESYFEDYMTARIFPDEPAREAFYAEMKSAAESGWDFSSRWFVTADGEADGNLTDVRASRILPVDLNAIFAGALELVGDFRDRLKDRRAARKWWSLARYWRSAIDAVLWNDEDGVWYDYDAQARVPRRYFYPSCVAPLWAGAVERYAAPVYAARLVRYLLRSGALDFPGGVPASVLHSGEQWDYPNAWPPLQSILIGGLEASGQFEARRLAREQAALWVRANHLGYTTWHKMFEKYSAVQPGHEGGGGEYSVQDGFGWTNGVLLELLHLYGGELTLHDNAMEAASRRRPYVPAHAGLVTNPVVMPPVVRTPLSEPKSGQVETFNSTSSANNIPEPK
ncbi:Trehalase [Eumeta japonica]|uniref:Trehalase n=1 Tax=Eumeta variegata TaxID=151549 RepID=A0A4C1VN71_EUMVA|nr:Trehalase [Eumeta japonica]